MNDRYILVIADGSKEMEVALQYACARSKKTERKISNRRSIYTNPLGFYRIDCSFS